METRNLEERPQKMTSRIGKRTIAILAFIALALSVIIPLSIPKAFSAPDCHRAEAGDYGAKIDKVVADFTAEIKKVGIYGYGVHNGNVYSRALDSIVPGFGEGREIDQIIEKSKYSLEDILGEGANNKRIMSGLFRGEDGTTTSDATINIESPKKTVDEEKLKEVIASELAEHLSKNPQEICEGGNDTKPGDHLKPSCKKAEVKDYAAGIEKVVDKIENSRGPEFATARIDVYNWDTSILSQINPAITEDLLMSDEQVKQAFGENTEWHLTATGPAQILDENGRPHSVGEGTVYFNVSGTYNYNRKALLKIITDKVAEFLSKNPQEICEGGNDPKPGTAEPTTEPTTPGNDTKPGDNTKPGDDTQPGETSKDGQDANNGGQAAPEGTDTNGDSQTVLESATEAGGLATTGAAGLIALGVSVLLVGAGAALAIRRRKHDM